MAPEVQESLKRLKRAEAEKQETVDRRRNLHEQISALLKQVALASEEASVKTKELHEAAEEHDRINCLQLCTKMHVKLPREVRDMIYDQIHGPDFYENVKKRTYCDMEDSRAEGPQLLPFIFRNSRTKHDFRYSQHPSRWWLDDHLSRPVATELIERWYQLRTFVFNSKHLYMLPDFLTNDIFNKDLEPGTLMYRLRCNVEIVRNQDAQSKTLHLQGLKHLGLIQNKRVDLVIRLFCPRRLEDEEKKEGMRMVLNALRPLVRELRQGGFEKVAVWNGSPKQDLTVLFKVGEEEYQEKLKLFGLTEETEEADSS